MTDKQLAANRANAQKSTGPRTADGKARSSRNARKHLFSSADFAIVRLEDRDAVDRLRADLIGVYQPINSQETFAIERIAVAQHNLLRVARLEAGLGTATLNRALLFVEEETPFVPLQDELNVDPNEIKEQNRAYCIAQGFHKMNRETPATWSLFLRYQAQTERLYRRAVEDLERLIKLRPNLPPPVDNDEIDDDNTGDSPNEAILEGQPNENTTASEPENEAASATIRQVAPDGEKPVVSYCSRILPCHAATHPQSSQSPSTPAFTRTFLRRLHATE
jgi:hypothetical protein